jgi:CelD/BcsL family acetyltransferase involved in cellulose biosynthesis
MACELDLQEFTTSEALESLRSEWGALWTRANGATPFQAPQWLLPWWRHLGTGELVVLALRHRGFLVGLVPWLIQGDPFNSSRTVVSLGSGVSDYLDALFEPGFEASGVESSLRWLETNCYRWDTADLGQLQSASPLIRVASPANWSDQVVLREPCPILRLGAEPDGFAHAIPAHQLANLRYYRARAERLGAIEMERATQATAGAIFGELLRLHRKRWGLRGQPGVLADPAVERFHSAAIAEFAALGVLRLYALRIAGRVAAVFYGFMCDRRAYYYLGGFDPEFDSISPGTLLIGYAIEQAISEGASEFDFLRGQERYKYLWGAEDCPTYGRLLRHATASQVSHHRANLHDLVTPLGRGEIECSSSRSNCSKRSTPTYFPPPRLRGRMKEGE